MNDTERRDLLRKAQELMLSRGSLDQLVGALRSYHGGYAGGSGGGRSSVGGHSDPTGSMERDESRQALHRVDALVQRLAQAVVELDSLRQHWTKPARMPTRREQVIETGGKPGCEVVGTAGSWEPEHVYSDVKANLDRKYRLGRWAYEWVLRNGRTPTKAEIEAHLQGRRPLVKVNDLTRRAG